MAGRWAASCTSLLPSPTPGLVDGFGHNVSTFTNNTWGIDFATCAKYCNSYIIPLDFNFQSFANSFTNFLLPWLALTAQLPFETGSNRTDFEALCLAVGSPALITFSLSLTILNRSWIRERFDELYRRSKRDDVGRRYPELGSRLRNAQYLLQEAQQDPIRASQEDGWLSSLVVVGANQDWWDKLKMRLQSTRRQRTFSLFAQITTAFVAWLFTIISSFIGALGDTGTSLQISGGSIWIWMIPVIIGWVLVGTQWKSNTTDHALGADPAQRALDPPIASALSNNGTQYWVYRAAGEQYGIQIKSGLTQRRHRIQTVAGGFNIPPREHLYFPEFWGNDINGDEKRSGPIFNYAKVFTWWQFAQSVGDAYEAVIENVKAGKGCRKRAGIQQQAFIDANGQQRRRALLEDWDETRRSEENLEGDAQETANFCGIDNTWSIPAYPAWNDIPSSLWVRILVASLTAMFVQWGTTGPSIMIAYLTPTQGLGCRSGSYLFYGVAGTVVWLCLMASMALSHGAMLLYQTKHQQHPSIDLRQNKNDPPRHYRRTAGHVMLCAAAILMRYLGKIVAVVNAVWLLASSLMEMIGGYDNCWCESDYLSLRGSGWVVLFKTADDLAASVKLPLGAGFATSILVCFFSFAFFYFGSTESKDD